MKGKTKFRILFAVGLLSIFSCGNREEVIPCPKNEIPKKESHEKYNKYFVPVSGNSFITVKPQDATEVITEKQLGNWTDPNAVISTYFRIGKSGKLNIGIKASVPHEKMSTIKVLVNGTEKKISLKGTKFKEYNAGEFQISTPGYVKVDIQGVERTGDYFADVTDITFSGEAAAGENNFAYKPNFYNFIRKGPSSDIYFNLPKEEVSYFYNESVILEDNPYMGFVPFNFSSSILEITTQNEEKVIYFDVINDSYNDPKKVPEDSKTKLNKKGDDVQFIEFSGGGSARSRGLLKYDWEIGETYKFLTKVKPDGSDVDYTVWFQPPGESSWELIISMKRKNWKIKPGTNLYSFLESNTSEEGYLSRKVEYNNPWTITESGKWIPLTEANFSTFNSDVYNQRTDAVAGTTKNGFFLQSGGFFNDIIKPNTKMSIPNNALTHPDIDFDKLP